MSRHRVDWFEQEIDKLVRQSRKATRQRPRPDPLNLRSRVKSVILRSRIALRLVREQPELAPVTWNAIMLGYVFQDVRYGHNWGDQMLAAKRQRDGAAKGRTTFVEHQTERAQQRADQVLLVAMNTQHRQRRRLSQRGLSLLVADILNRTDPPPDPLYTDESVRSILKALHFFQEITSLRKKSG